MKQIKYNIKFINFRQISKMKILVKFILDLFDAITEIKTTKFLKKILSNDINVLIECRIT